MKTTGMTPAEVIDFIGAEQRKPTLDEVELIVSKAVTALLQNEQKKRNIPLNKLQEEAVRIAEARTPAIRDMSMVYDMKQVGKRIFVYTDFDVLLQDHESERSIIREFADYMHPEDAKTYQQATSSHNHVYASTHFILIDEENMIEHLNTTSNNICLKKTQSGKTEIK